ncbi:MAG: galactose mutarotase [Clostridia bacterium]|nr:galactose mutarotase [Clostridia bacterium]
MTVPSFLFSDSELGPVRAFVLDSGQTQITVLNLGCIIQKWIYRGKDIVCGFDSADAYLHSGTYYGAMIGRCCNRMRSARIAGREYPVTPNENGMNHLHGGNRGFDKKIWDVAPFESEDGSPGLRMTAFSEDGEEGYPGNLRTTVTYLLSGTQLTIACDAVSDADTAVNLTNHAYFNLNGPGGDILDHTLYIPSWYVSECDGLHIPTGKHLPIWGGPLDFNVPKKIGKDIHADSPLLTPYRGYDNNYVLRKSGGMTLAARAEGTDIALEVLTDLPCLQLYTGNYPEDGPMKYGLPQTPYRAFCLETQMEPDFTHVDGTYLRAGEHYRCETVYRLEPLPEESGPRW